MHIQKPPRLEKQWGSLLAVITRLQTCAWQTRGSLISSSSLDGRSGIKGEDVDTSFHVGVSWYHQPTQSSITCGSLPIFCTFWPYSNCSAWKTTFNSAVAHLWHLRAIRQCGRTQHAVPPGFICSLLLNRMNPALGSGLAPRVRGQWLQQQDPS